MIRLESLELLGFKSFAHKTKLTFPGNLTGIVGPNGCGKSNIADALRWILGEQSSKLLRGKKAEDVIFAGSSKQAAMSLASAQLTLHNDVSGGDLPPGQIIILRKIDRTGASDYFINGEKVRAGEIQMILAQANVGVKTYAVIGQGMVEGWLNATPADRRQLLDDAAGLRPLILKRDQVENELNKTQAHLKEVELLLMEIKPRLSSLERQAKKYEKLAEMTNELAALEKKYYAAWQDQIHQEKKNISEKINKLRESEIKIQATVDLWQKNFEKSSAPEKKDQELPQMQKKYQELLAQKSQLDRKIWQTEQVTISTHAKTIALPTLRLWHEEITAILGDDTNFLTRVRIWAEKIARELKAASAPDSPHHKHPQLETWKNDLEKLENDLGATQKNINSLIDAASSQPSELLQAQHQIMSAQKELFELKEKKQELAVKEANILADAKNFQQEVAMLSSELIRYLQNQPKNIDPSALEERSTVIKLQRQVAALGEYDAGIMEEYKTTKERHDFLFEQNQDLSQTLKQLQEALLQLHEHIKSQFNLSFNAINDKFQEFFQQLFNGGKAKLILQETKENLETIESESLPEQTAGVEIMATPPHKKLATITALSGGEKALTAIALLCAILNHNASPFVVLDEVDAALDEANSTRYAAIIKQLSQKTQFIIITHNRQTMQQAQALYGVSMAQNGISQILSVQLEK